jgi:hypothetical protein
LGREFGNFRTDVAQKHHDELRETENRHQAELEKVKTEIATTKIQVHEVKERLGLDDGMFLSVAERGKLWARLLGESQDKVRSFEAKLNSTSVKKERMVPLAQLETLKSKYGRLELIKYRQNRLTSDLTKKITSLTDQVAKLKTENGRLADKDTLNENLSAYLERFYPPESGYIGSNQECPPLSPSTCPRGPIASRSSGSVVRGTDEFD